MINLSEEIRYARPSGPTAVTLGVFDGVHLGHNAIINTLKADAIELGITPVALTFSSHPLLTLKPRLEIKELTSLEDRIQLLNKAGAEYVIPINFTNDVSNLTAREFLVLLKRDLQLKHLVIGPNFALGFERRGTATVLQKLGSELDFSVKIVDPYLIGSTTISSTNIRQALQTGNLGKVSLMLGRYFSLKGTVIRGQGRGGEELGFPTCNLSMNKTQILPSDGIFAAWATVKNKRYKAAASVGTKPTFESDGARVVEAYILDFDADVYGLDIRLEFVETIRNQQKFNSADELISQMKIDVDQIKGILTENR